MIPKSVKIFGHEYNVVIDPDYIQESGGSMGRCNNYTNTITISGGLPISSMNEVLIHEIIEAIDYRLELNLDHHTICVLGESLNQVINNTLMSCG